MYPTDIKMYGQTKVLMWMFIAALFITVKNIRQLVTRWTKYIISKQWNTMPELKEQAANTWYNVDDPHTHNIKLKKLEAEAYILCDSIYVKF